MVKSFAGTQALQGVNLIIQPNSIHALVGENGAGKSTLIKILSGFYRADAGRVFVDGEEVTIGGPAHARKLGLSFVHQELNVVPYFDGYENVALGEGYPRRGGFISWGKLKDRVDSVAEDLGVDLPLSDLASDMAPAHRQLLLILKALVGSARLLVLDEPSSTLSHAESELLFATLEKLKERGTSVLYVSHRLDEIFRLSSEVTVFKDGANVGSYATDQLSKDELISLISGKPRDPGVMAPQEIGERAVLSVRNLSRGRAVKNVSFDVLEGEVLGLAGLMGSGRTELLRAIAGADRVDSGTVLVDGKAIHIRGPRSSIRAGVVLLPEERKSQGLIPAMSVRENTTIASLPRHRRWWWLPFLDRKAELRSTQEIIDRLGIQTAGPDEEVRFLSGGNQQKVVLGRWVTRGARVFLFDEPTRGVDVGAKQEIFQLIYALAAEGASVVVVSSDLEELPVVCDRILVMREGKLVANVQSDGSVDETRLLALCYQEEG